MTTTRRRALTAALALPTAALLTAVLASCADDVSVDAGGTTPSGIVHPTGTGDAVVRIDEGGGLVPEGYDFSAAPRLVITGDGRVIQPGPMIEIYPGPAVTPLVSRTITEAGMQRVLTVLEDAGLLAPAPSYEPDPRGPQVVDASTTTLVVSVGGQAFTHTAYALGFEDLDTTPARRALAGAVATLADLPTLLGDELGPEQVEPPVTLGVTARIASPEELVPPDAAAGSPAPEVVAWPEGAGDLASASTCLLVDAASLPDLAAWNQTTRFTQAGSTYTVWFRVVLPGDRTCPAA